MRWQEAVVYGIFTGAPLEFLILSQLITVGDAVNATILGVTGYIVWKYTVEAQKSNEIQERPLLDFYVLKTRYGANDTYDLKLKNIGKSTAYNITIDAIQTPEGYTYGPFISDDTNSRIEVEKEEIIKFWVKTPRGATEMYERVLGFVNFVRRAFHMSRGTAQVSLSQRKTGGIFVFHYDGVNGSTYYTVFRLYPALPLALDTDVIAQFIDAGRGICTRRRAVGLCIKKELHLHTLERTNHIHNMNE